MTIDARFELEKALKVMEEAGPSHWCSGAWGITGKLDGAVTIWMAEVPYNDDDEDAVNDDDGDAVALTEQVLRGVMAGQQMKAGEPARFCAEGALAWSLYQELGELTATVAAYREVCDWVEGHGGLNLRHHNDTSRSLDEALGKVREEVLGE